MVKVRTVKEYRPAKARCAEASCPSSGPVILCSKALRLHRQPVAEAAAVGGPLRSHGAL